MTRIYEMGLPRRVIAGVGSVSRLSTLVKETKTRNAIMLTDKSIYETGITLAVEKILSQCNITLIKDVSPESEYTQVIKIYDEIKNEENDLIVAVGGRSIMDTAKILSILLTSPDYSKNILDASLMKNPGIKSVFIPTTTGTGSEATPNSFVVVPEKELEVG